VLVKVADTGIGMTREVQSQIFEPFFTTKAVGRGTGLGLATVLGIVKQTGGYIWVDSEPGHGTAFRIAFPRSSPSTGRASSASIPSPLSQGHGERVLLVEDEPLVRAVVQRMLTGAGYAVDVASDGVEALAVLEAKGPPDLVLTDLMMPKMGGTALAAKVRELHPKVPLLFMSGYSSDAADLGNFSGVELVVKPPTMAALLAAVRKAMSRG
jgi:two-component system cell cycle sensor histidine kinase/response regulator CckA